MHRVGREKHTGDRVIIARMVIIQSRDRVVVLAGEAFVGSHIAGLIALPSIGRVELGPQHGGRSCRVAVGRQDTAQRIGHEDVGGLGIRWAGEFGEQLTSQSVIVRAARKIATAVIGIVFQPEGIDRDLDAAAARRALQRTIARGIIGIPGRVDGGDLPLDHLIERIIGERGDLVIVGAGDNVAPRVVRAEVVGGSGIAARRSRLVNALQLMRSAAATVEVLLIAAGAAHWPLPQLSQVRVDIAHGVGCAGKATVGCQAAAGAAAGTGRRLRVTGPHELILLVVAEILGFGLEPPPLRCSMVVVTPVMLLASS